MYSNLTYLRGLFNEGAFGGTWRVSACPVVTHHDAWCAMANLDRILEGKPVFRHSRAADRARSHLWLRACALADIPLKILKDRSSCPEACTLISWVKVVVPHYSVTSATPHVDMRFTGLL